MNEMGFVAHGVTLALAWFLSVNVAASAIVAASVSCFTPRLRCGRGWGSLQAPGFWLALRLLPAALSAAFVAGASFMWALAVGVEADGRGQRADLLAELASADSRTFRHSILRTWRRSRCGTCSAAAPCAAIAAWLPPMTA